MDHIEAVKRQAEDADKIWKQLYTKQELSPEEKVAKEKADAEAKAKADAEAKAKAESTPENYEQKFKVLKGKYDAEVPAMAYTIAELKNRLEKIEKPPADNPAKVETKTEEIPEVKVLKEEFPDIYSGIKPLIKQTLDEELSRVEERIEKKIDGKSVDEKYNEELAKDVPDWEILNRDKEFLDWLKEPDPSGYAKSKHELLIHAWNTRDAKTSAKFFTDFKKSKESKSNPIDPENIETEPPRGSNSMPKVDNQGGLDEGVLRGQLQNLYDEGSLAARGRGRWVGKPNEFKQEEERILKLILKARGALP